MIYLARLCCEARSLQWDSHIYPNVRTSACPSICLSGAKSPKTTGPNLVRLHICIPYHKGPIHVFFLFVFFSSPELKAEDELL